jgi:hypothetical protein
LWIVDVSIGIWNSILDKSFEIMRLNLKTFSRSDSRRAVVETFELRGAPVLGLRG